jgi:transcriptional regulator with XRE-family HTH domain
MAAPRGRTVANATPATGGVRIGGRLRAARQGRGLTLDKVAEATDLTKGFLSRLERDEVSPSVASLVSVCEVLGIRVGELFETPQTQVVRAAEGRRINFGGRKVQEFLLTPGTQSQLQVIHSTIAPGGSGGDELYTLDCEVEFVYVVRGELTVTLAAESVVLAAGDAFTFPGREPHTWANARRGQECEVLWALAPAP